MKRVYYTHKEIVNFMASQGLVDITESDINEYADQWFSFDEDHGMWYMTN